VSAYQFYAEIFSNYALEGQLKSEFGGSEKVSEREKKKTTAPQVLPKSGLLINL
jgi:hypothetical protein